MVRLCSLLLLVLGAALAPAPATSADAAHDSLMAPFLGTWTVNEELSTLRALGDPNLPEQNPKVLSQYVHTMSQIIELSIGDSLITYSRGRHTLSFPYEILNSDQGGKVHVLADPGGQNADWLLEITAAGNLYIASSATQMKDFYVYDRGRLERGENGLPVVAAPPAPKNPLGLPSAPATDTDK